MKKKGKKQQLPVVVLAGFSCAGKSTLARAFTDAHDWELLDQYVIYKGLATTAGFERSREWLNAVGRTRFISETSMETAKIINAYPLDSPASSPKGIVIDACFGPVMVNLLKDNVKNGQLIVVALTASKSLRAERIVGRMNTSLELAGKELVFRDSFLRGSSLAVAMTHANFRVSNEGPLTNALQELVNGLSNMGIQVR